MVVVVVVVAVVVVVVGDHTEDLALPLPSLAPSTFLRPILFPSYSHLQPSSTVFKPLPHRSFKPHKSFNTCRLAHTVRVVPGCSGSARRFTLLPASRFRLMPECRAVLLSSLCPSFPPLTIAF
jgi:hypothetical protein